MRVFKWTLDFSSVKESSIAPAWIRIEGLPLYMFDEMSLLSISNSIGRPIRVDPRNIHRSILNTARVCVELDVSKPLLESIWISFEDELTKKILDGFWVKVYYDIVPQLCSYCSHIGHNSEWCKRRNEEIFKARQVVHNEESGRMVLQSEVGQLIMNNGSRIGAGVDQVNNGSVKKLEEQNGKIGALVVQADVRCSNSKIEMETVKVQDALLDELAKKKSTEQIVNGASKGKDREIQMETRDCDDGTQNIIKIADPIAASAEFNLAIPVNTNVGSILVQPGDNSEHIEGLQEAYKSGHVGLQIEAVNNVLLFQNEILKVDTTEIERKKIHNRDVDVQIAKYVAVGTQNSAVLGSGAKLNQICIEKSMEAAGNNAKLMAAVQPNGMNTVDTHNMCNHGLAEVHGDKQTTQAQQGEIFNNGSGVGKSVDCHETPLKEAPIPIQIDIGKETVSRVQMASKACEAWSDIADEEDDLLSASALVRKVKKAGFHSPIPEAKKTLNESQLRTPSTARKLRWRDEMSSGTCNGKLTPLPLVDEEEVMLEIAKKVQAAGFHSPIPEKEANYNILRLQEFNFSGQKAKME